MKLLVTGARGMLGTAVVERFSNDNNYAVIGTDVTGEGLNLDICDTAALKSFFEKEKPGLVINTAAYTAVDLAESEEDKAFEINALGVENLAKVSKEFGAKIVHISTDFVFHGREGDKPFKEDDGVNPRGVYARSKLSGEEKLKAVTDDYLLIRTSWLYGPNGKNFVTAIKNKIETSTELKVVCDQYGSPTYTVDLAEAIYNLVSKELKGVFHFSNETGPTGISWHEFAVGIWGQMVIREMPYKIDLIQEIPTEGYPTPAERPKYSVLDTSKYRKLTGKTAPDWKEALIRYFNTFPKTINTID